MCRARNIHIFVVNFRVTDPSYYKSLDRLTRVCESRRTAIAFIRSRDYLFTIVIRSHILLSVTLSITNYDLIVVIILIEPPTSDAAYLGAVDRLTLSSAEVYARVVKRSAHTQLSSPSYQSRNQVPYSSRTFCSRRLRLRVSISKHTYYNTINQLLQLPLFPGRLKHGLQITRFTGDDIRLFG